MKVIPMKLRPLAAALMLATSACANVAMAAAPAASPVFCSDSFIVENGGYVSCQGPLSGNIATGRVNTASFAGYGDFELTSVSGTGSFSVALDTEKSGTLNFGAAQTGFFVVGIKGGPGFSLYLFDGGRNGISSLDFDTFGIVTGGGRAGPGLSHAALFTSLSAGPTPPIPEPASALLLLAGLGAVGFVARRRSAGQ